MLENNNRQHTSYSKCFKITFILHILVFLAALTTLILLYTKYYVSNINSLTLYINKAKECDALCYFCSDCNLSSETIYKINLNKTNNLNMIEWHKLIHCDSQYSKINNCIMNYKTLTSNFTINKIYNHNVLYGNKNYKFKK